MNDKVWLSVPTAGKLQPKWEGGWRVISVKSPVTIKIINGRRSKVVHSNRLQRQILVMGDSSGSTVTDKKVLPPWAPPLVEHFIEETVSLLSCYPS